MNRIISSEGSDLLRRATIGRYFLDNGCMEIFLDNIPAFRNKTGSDPSITIPIPYAHFYNSGFTIGSLPEQGSTIIVGKGVGDTYYFVSYLCEDPEFAPTINKGELLISANNSTKISLNQKSNLLIGSDSSNIFINTKTSAITTNFSSENKFTNGYRSINGEVRRDLSPNALISDDLKLYNDEYSDKLFLIGLDPTVPVNKNSAGVSKNPPFIENRELIYEFSNEYNVSDLYNESLLYSTGTKQPTDYKFINRRKSRTDTLSLGLYEPNFLMETVKGTVVDIFGNILDINRLPLQIGKNQLTINNSDSKTAYLNIRALERKSLAYHFEINARKDLDKSTLPDINSNANYARDRSRFFIDIDKEGQFKINVPASSNTGNIPLLTRYENFSTVSGLDNNNPNKLVFREDKIDIVHDSFAASEVIFNDDGSTKSINKGSIKIDDSGANAAPLDRITDSHIKHGTAYHDVLKTCYAHQSIDRLTYPGEWGQPDFMISKESLPVLENVVSSEIKISGSDANAGGRSGSINFDGSIDFNIGANTIDRQSLWLDTAGGIVANIGRDKNNTSAAISMDGHVYMQIGAMGVSSDSRFNVNNGEIGATLDIRVLNSGGRATLIRIDDNGISIMSPGNIAVHAGQNMKLTADADIEIEAESVIIQKRLVSKGTGGSI